MQYSDKEKAFAQSLGNFIIANCIKDIKMASFKSSLNGEDRRAVLFSLVKQGKILARCNKCKNNLTFIEYNNMSCNNCGLLKKLVIKNYILY